MAGFGSGMSGAGAGWMEDAFKDMREDMWNERAYYERGRDREHAVEDAKLANQRNIDNYKNRYQWMMQDMSNAGLNPMLAAGASPGGVAGASPAQQTGAGFPRNSGSSGKSTGVAAYAQTASAAQAVAQADLIASQSRLTDAQTRATEQSTNESRARERTEVERPGQVRQQINESIEMTNRLIQDAKVGVATAANLVQQTRNLQELVPQIRVTVEQVKADTRLKGRHDEVARLDAALKDLERVAMLAKQPQALQDQSVHESFVGSLSAVIRALTGLGAHTSIGR